MAQIVSPAGDLEKLKYSVLYGANIVYLAGKEFGMRSRAGNFLDSEMEEGIAFAHAHGCKVEITLNIAARNDDVPKMLEAAKEAKAMGADSLIVADIGVVGLLHEKMPDMPLTLSTQANALNTYSLKYWADLGIKRAVLARELSFAELEEISKNRPAGIELEIFVHGAMCISYSGRCLISSYMASRDSNRGDCAQPCRWAYTISEEKRPGQSFRIEEDSRSTYLFSSKDLCLISKVKDLMDIGIDAFKIEGRVKSAYYASVVTNCYAIAIDRAKSSQAYNSEDLYLELEKVSHRPYTEAFAGEGEQKNWQNYSEISYDRGYKFAFEVISKTEGGVTLVKTKNRFSISQSYEAVSPGKLGEGFSISEIFDPTGKSIAEAVHPNEIVKIKATRDFKAGDLARYNC